MEVKDKVSTGRKETVLAIKALLDDVLKLLEERGDMHNNTRTNKVSAVGVDQTGGRGTLEIKGLAINNDGVTSVVTALTTSADINTVAEEINELAFTLVAPLGNHSTTLATDYLQM